METVQRQVTLPVNLEAAWELLTTPDDLGAWLGAEVVLDPTRGAAGRVIDHDGTLRHLVVDGVDEGHRLSWSWWTDGEDQPSHVEITLLPTPDGTLVTVVEQGLPVGAPTARASAAWSHRLLHLEALLLIAAAVRG